MPLINLFDYLRRQKRSLNGTRPVEKFSAILDHERARVHRNGHVFSLVVFDVATMDRTRTLERALGGRVRSTDEVGWLDRQHIGVILPDTSAEGAWKLANGVCQRMAASGSPPVCAVYTYPSQWLPGGNGPSRQNRSAEMSDRTPSAGQDRMQNARRPMKGIESFLGHRLPVWKRALDVVGALSGLVFLSPLFLIIAVLIKVVSPGPTFFKQERVGYLGKPFALWKFRTMRPDSDTSLHKKHLNTLMHSDQPMIKLDTDHDPRIIPMGRFLRTSCLDELPQLINVLRGEMSLIGPRPCLPYEAEDYLLWQTGRFDMVPGMTGLWQVSGRSRTTFNEMMRFDIWYARHRSLGLDIKILLKTIPAVLTS